MRLTPARWWRSFMRVDLYCDEQEEIVILLQQLKTNQGILMATVQEMAQAVAALKNAVDGVPAIIDALEARVTAAVKAGGMSAADKAAVDQAFTDANDALTKLSSAAADATDNVDEADTGTGGGDVGPVNPI